MKFIGSTLVSGAAFILAAIPLTLQWFAVSPTVYSTLFTTVALALLASNLLKTGFELSVLRYRSDKRFSSLGQSARLLLGPLRSVLFGRMAISAVVTISALLLSLLAGSLTPTAAAVGSLTLLAVVLLGELTERYLFFSAVVAPRMPGGLN